MEVWALEAYGAAYTLQEMLTVKSLLQIHVEAERTEFLHQDVEGFRDAGLEVVVAAHDRLVDLGASGDVVRLRPRIVQRSGQGIAFLGPERGTQLTRG